MTTQITRQVFPISLDTDAPGFRALLEKMRTLSAGIDASRKQRGALAAIRRIGLTLSAGLTFARLYLQPVEHTALPASVRLQPIW